MNKNLQGGYYIVSLGGVDLLGESVSLPNIAKLLYEAKKYKFVVLQDIVMDGNMKVAIPVFFDASMAYTTEPEDWDEETDGEFVPEPIYTATIYNVYGKNIAIDAEGGATITDYMEGGIDPTDLYGKFVRIIEAPESTTLTEEQVELFKNGVFVNGEYIGLKNPVFLPATITSGYVPGSIFGICLSGGKIAIYCIDENKAISLSNDYLNFSVFWNNQVEITLRSNRDLQLWAARYIFLQNFRFVDPPDDAKHYFLRSIGRVGSWLEGNGFYLHTIVFNVSGGSTITIRIVSDSATACALDSVSGNFVIAGATCLIPSNMGNAVLTPFDANGFNPDIHLFDSATGAYSTAVTLASVESDVITPIG